MKGILDKANVQDIFELNGIQSGMLFHYLREVNNNLYNVQISLDINGALDIDILTEALKIVQQHNDVLRSIFRWERISKPLQIVLKDCPVNFKYHDISSGNTELAENEYSEADRNERFDLSELPLRFTVIKLAENQYRLNITHHHIIYDGWSTGIFLKELFGAYRAISGRETPSFSNKPVYRDVQLAIKRKKESSAGNVFWGDYLKQYKPCTLFSRDNTRDFEQSRVERLLFKVSNERLDALAREYKVTKAAVIYATYAVLQYKFSHTSDLVFGTTVSSRDAAIQGNDMVMGNFINTVPFRVKLSEESRLRDIIGNIYQDILLTNQFTDASYFEIKQLLGLQQSEDLYDSLVVIENYPLDEKAIAVNEGLDIRLRSAYENTSIPFGVYVFFKEECEIELVYKTANYTPEQAASFATCFATVFNAILDNADQGLADIQLFTAAQKEEVYEEISSYTPQVISQRKSIPASYHQERLWFIDKFESGFLYKAGPVYHNIPVLIDFSGTTNKALLKAAVLAVVKQHPVLTTRIVSINDQPFQVFNENFQLPWAEVDANADEAGALKNEEINTPFEFDKFLVRAKLFSFSGNSCKLVVTVHHAVADRYSALQLRDAILLNYNRLVNGEEVEVNDESLNYAGFSAWQRESLSKLDNDSLPYWKRQLNGKLKALELPTDRPRAAIHTYTVASCDVNVPGNIAKQVLLYQEKSGVPANVILMAAFKILLYKYCRHEEVVIGSSISNRRQQALSGVMGPVANLVALRTYLSQQTSFDEYCPVLEKIFAEAAEYGSIPFDKLVIELAPDKDMSRTALFDVLFQYEEKTALPTVNGLSVTVEETNKGYGKYDLNLFVQGGESKFEGKLVYNADYFDASTIEAFARNYYELLQNLLLSPAAEIGKVEIIPVEEKSRLLQQFNNLGVDYPADKTIVDLFEEQVSRTPGNIAVKYNGQELTYAGLKKQADQLATLLCRNGVADNAVVGLLTDRSVKTVIGMLAILKAGGAYLPIDTDYPEDRVNYLVKDSGTKLLLTTKDVAVTDFGIPVLFIEDGETVSDITAPVYKSKPADLCYVIYTSGTTGQPKGVMVEHRNVVRLFKNDAFQFDFDASDTWTMFHSHCFDFSVWEMYGALLFGGRLIIIPKAIAKDTVAFRNILAEEKVTVLNQTPSAFYSLSEAELTDAAANLQVRYVIFGGESLNPSKLLSWSTRYPGCRMINMYGITETTVHVTYKEIGAAETASHVNNIGRPIPTLSVYIFDEYQNPVPDGVIGELYVGGEGVTRGYLGKEALTAQKFIVNPFNAQERLYRSGDLARVLSNGELEHIGRIDNQVQLRGFRIELGEIENRLNEHESVRETVVVARDSGEDTCLAAYYISGEEIDTATLRNFLLARVPDYMVPAYFVRMAKFPLTSNGKLDKAALPNPRVSDDEDFELPAGAVEEKMVEIWSEILKLDASVISVNKSFFELGGHSLRATGLVNKVLKEFNVTIHLQDVFVFQDIRSLSRLITEAEQSATATTAVPKAAVKDYYQLSSPQKRVYFLHQLDPASLAYNMPYAIRLKGTIDREKLNDAFSKLVSRHEILHTSFELVNDEPVMKVQTSYNFKIEEYEATGNEQALISSFIRPFDLRVAPLIRVGLIKVAADNHVLLIDMHHIINDGVSQAVFVKDFIAGYNDEQLPELQVQYKDYAEWQQSPAEQERVMAQKDFWMNEFSEPVPALDLPLDAVRPAVKTNIGDTIDFELSYEETQALKSLAEKEGSTLFMAMLSAYYIFLSKLSNHEDIVIGTPLAGRQHEDLDKLIGLFLNTLPLRNSPGGHLSFNTFLSLVKAKTLACFEHQSYPYETLIDDLKTERDTSRNPLFDALFLFQNYEAASLAVPGVIMEPCTIDRKVSKLDLTLEATEAEGRLLLSFEYAADLFRSETVERFITYFRKIISTVIAQPDIKIADIEMLSEQEKQQLLVDFNNTALAFDREATIVSLFEKQLQVSPDEVAVVFDRNQLTYRELDEKSSAFAAQLTHTYNVKKGDLVAVMVDRSEKLMISLLGVLKSGAAYVPVDPSYPNDRIGYILGDSQARVLVVNKELASGINYDGKVFNINRDAWETPSANAAYEAPSASDLCYLIYTSGSTGQPKGVMIAHRNVVNFFAGMSQQLPVTSGDCMLAVTNTSFDISVLELFWTLCNGVQIVLHPSDISLSNLDQYVDGTGERTGIDFSLFFFSSYKTAENEKYKLLLDSAQFADREGFKAVWTPERHFHDFGGLYPNPSVTSAALAVLTKQIEIRSGSVVSPLHDVIRIAEEWSVVDNLSNGRIGLSFASGWNPDDFVLAKGSYSDRHQTMYEQIDQLKSLWRGESIKRVNGAGKEVEVRIFPNPVQQEIPIWVTSAGNAETFRSAGLTGCNVLTHFLGQDVSMLKENIRVYREARKQAGYDRGQVVLMIHTYVGTDINEVEATVEQPFIDYLKSSIGLSKVIFEQAGFNEEDLTEELKNKILKGSFKRYYKSGSLIGTKSSCAEMIRQLQEVEVDELACLIDFGVAQDKVMESLHHLNDLQKHYSAGAGARVHKLPTIMQSTPSFVKLLKGDASSARFLNSLRMLLVGGEAVSASLLRKVKQDNAGVDIYNMYGPTETTIWSAVYHFEEEISKVSIGKPIANTQVYILDSNLKLQPPGVVGYLYLGGDGLARGYWNRPELTAERFIPNPFNNEGYIYNTGDMARWMPDGNLEYMGRNDHQVKIRGFRIELEEIEKNILHYHGIKETVVVAQQDAEGDKKLVAYVVAADTVDFTELRAELGKTLPFYMVPGYFMQLEKMPLTWNGKLDRKLLPLIEAQVNDNYVAPQTNGEKLLVEVWSKVLGIEKIGINDNFFSAGGDSIKSIQIVSRVRNAGFELSVKDIFTTQNIKELAAKLKATSKVSDQSAVTGVAGLSPIQRWLFDGSVVNKHHYNQAVMLKFPGGITAGTVTGIFEKLQAHHDALRMVFREENGQTVSETVDTSLAVSIAEFDLQQDDQAEQTCLATANELQAGIDLANGPLMKLGLFHFAAESRLLVIIHHLVVDGISWRILFEDIESLYHQVQQQQPLSLPLKTDSFLSWPGHLAAYTKTRSFAKATEYWRRVDALHRDLIPRDFDGGLNAAGSSREAAISLGAHNTSRLLTQVHIPFGTQINDIIFAALVMSIKAQYGNLNIAIDIESHGREELVEGVDISRTVGWFTSIYQAVFSNNSMGIADTVKYVKETLRKIPNNGFDYLLFKQHESSNPASDAQLFFNYLGQFDADTTDKAFAVSVDGAGDVSSLNEVSDYDWDFLGMIADGRFTMRLKYSEQQYKPETIAAFMSGFEKSLVDIIDYCSAATKVELTPSDFIYKDLGLGQLEKLQEVYDIENIYALSPMQEGFMYHILLNVDSDDYFFQISNRVSGVCDTGIMEQSFRDLTARHDILRTVFIHEGVDRPLQVVLREKPIEFHYVDFRDVQGDEAKKEAIEEYKKADKARKFDLKKDPLLRLAVVQTENDKYYLIWSYHHILMDGWCYDILLGDFKTIYEGYANNKAVALPPAEPYSKYIQWLERRDKELSATYWQRYLADYNTTATLPQKTGTKDNAFDQQVCRFEIGKAETAMLQQLSAAQGVTVYTVIQAAWGMLLSKYNNTSDVVFGSVVSGRPSEVDGVETMMGLFINTIPVRVSTENTHRVAELLKAVQKNALESDEHSYNALAEVQSLSELGRGLFDHIMVFENFPLGEINDPEAAKSQFSIDEVEVVEQINYDFSVTIIPADKITVKLGYNAGKYEYDTIRQIGEQFCSMLNGFDKLVMAEISEVDILLDAERQRLLQEFNSPVEPVPANQTVVDIFEAQVAKTPDSIAVVHGNQQLTYRELNEKANCLAHYLRKTYKLKGDDFVGVMVDRSVSLLISILGVMKAGAAYVPVDKDYPASRKAFMVGDAAPKVLIIESDSLLDVIDYNVKIFSIDLEFQQLPLDETSCRNLDKCTGSDNLAYVIYTSGSTGKPKGVMVEHGNLVNSIMPQIDKFSLSAADHCLQFSSSSFDSSVWEIFTGLLSGSTLYMIQEKQKYDVAHFVQFAADNAISFATLPPAFFNVLPVEELGSIKTLITAGEQAVIEQSRKFARRAKFVNGYGPTECCICATIFDEPFGTTVPIGRPIANTQVYILNKQGKMMPQGAAGEICLGGNGVARGYLNNEVLTGEKFVENPFIPGTRMYRTGDLARWLPDGNIEFMGRVDEQVKIRGFRVELGEITAMLAGHENVKEAVVIAKEQSGGDKMLVAYYVPHTPTDSLTIRKYLAEKLPDYMVPSYYVSLDVLPLTINGKLDKDALDDLDIDNPEDYTAPSGETEEKLQLIWSDILKLDKERISADKSFFELGGHSLRASLLGGRIIKEFNVNMPLDLVFSLQTIQKIAEYLDNEQWLKNSRELQPSMSEEVFFID